MFISDNPIVQWLVSVLIIALIIIAFMFGGVLLTGFFVIVAVVFMCALVCDIVLGIGRGIASLLSVVSLCSTTERRE